MGPGRQAEGGGGYNGGGAASTAKALIETSHGILISPQVKTKEKTSPSCNAPVLRGSL